MCTDQPYSKRFPGCFSDSTIFDTPLERFLTIGAKNGAKVGQKPAKCKILGFQRNTHHLTWKTKGGGRESDADNSMLRQKLTLS